jgi:hypothetical protein
MYVVTRNAYRLAVCSTAWDVCVCVCVCVCALRVFALERIEREHRDLVGFEGLSWGGVLISSGCRDLLNWVSYVYPPPRGLLFLTGNPYMILYVYITIISGRNK